MSVVEGAYGSPEFLGTHQWSYDFYAVTRIGYYSDRKILNSGLVKEDLGIRGRLRAGINLKVDENWTAKASITGRYSSAEANHGFNIDMAASSSEGMGWGEATLDTFSVSYQSDKQWNITLGRMQTSKSLMGVTKKSLDRLDGWPRVSWTDGVSLWLDINKDWGGHFIVEYNSPRGPSNVKRYPLSFDSGRDRWSFFTAFESKTDWGPLVQRELDLTFIPQGNKREDINSKVFRADYLALVARTTASWPLGFEGKSLLFGIELGYAPDLGNDSAGTNIGRAVIASATIKNILPRHGLGLIAGRSNGDWLISPHLDPNESFVSLHYKWLLSKSGSWEFDIKRSRTLNSESIFDSDKQLGFWARYNHKF